MTKKNLLTSILIIFFACYLHAESFQITQFVLYDENYNRIEDVRNPAEIIYDELLKLDFQSLLDFEYISSKKYGDIISALDASKLCSVEGSDYVVYGFVQKNEKYWFSNIKLYENQSKKVIKEFFASDSIDYYDRFTEYLIQNVTKGLEELTGVIAEFYNKKERPTTMKLELGGFYWTPLTEKWMNVFTSTAGGKLGFDIYPPIPKIKLSPVVNMTFSGKILTSYYYGLGKENNYPLDLHSVAISALFGLNYNILKNHSLFIYTGPSVEYNFLFVSPKYESSQFHYDYFFGLDTLIGYEMKVNKIISLSADCLFNFRFNNDEYMTLKPGLSMLIKLF